MLAEFNTHRDFSRNSASSRAIPVAKQVLAVLRDPFIPAEFGTDIGGMQAGPKMVGAKAELAVKLWLQARDSAVVSALKLMTSPEYFVEVYTEHNQDLVQTAEIICREYLDKDSGLREREDVLETTKGITNRLLEPFMWHTVIVTATEWDNFFALRTDENAQLEIRTIAQWMKELYDKSEPTLLERGQWHLPFTDEQDGDDIEVLRKLSTGRCARVSYLTHDGKRSIEADIKMHDWLLGNGHMSPFEHAAQAEGQARYGNFVGWKQYRKLIPNEHNFALVKPSADATK